MRKFLSFVLYVCVGLPAALGALFTIGLGPRMLDRNFYKEALTDDRLYAAIASAKPGNDEGTTVFGGYTFDTGALYDAAKTALPPDEAKTLTRNAVDEAFDSVGPGGDNSIDLNLEALKKAAAVKLDAAAAAYVDALPLRDTAPGEGDVSFTRTGSSIASRRESAKRALGTALKTIPDTVSRTVSVDPDSSMRQMATPGSRLMRSPFLLALFATLAVGLSAAMAGGTASRRIALSGKRLIVPSVIAMIAGGILYLPGGAFLKGIIPPEATTAVSAETMTQLGSWFAHVFGPAARSLFLVGLSGASLGGMLIALRRVFEGREPSSEE
ncbi:MAG: hypothetical protein ABFC81_07210 [Rectinema sp.]